MITIAPLTTDAQWKWMKERASPIKMEDTLALIAHNEQGEIVACCVADSFGRDSCCVHLAIESPLVLKYKFMETLADGLFNNRGMKRVFGMVPSTNEKALKLNKHLGFTVIATVPNGYCEGVDYIIMEMVRESCRWLKTEQEAA